MHLNIKIPVLSSKKRTLPVVVFFPFNMFKVFRVMVSLITKMFLGKPLSRFTIVQTDIYQQTKLGNYFVAGRYIIPNMH